MPRVVVYHFLAPDSFDNQGAKPKLVRNRVNRNGQFGIQVVQGGWASIRECDLRGMISGKSFSNSKLTPAVKQKMEEAAFSLRRNAKCACFRSGIWDLPSVHNRRSMY